MKSRIIDSRIDFDVKDETAAFAPSPPLERIRSRSVNQAKKIPPTATMGETVLRTSRWWKLLSNTQFKGKADNSSDMKAKFSQNETKIVGSSVGYRVITLDRICVKVTKI